MKKRFSASAATAIFIFLTLLFALPLASCAPAEKDPLSYQDSSSRVEATLSSGTGKLSFVITLPAVRDASVRRDAVIELTSPETLSGVTVTVSGQVVTVSSGEMTLPVSPEAARRWLSVVGLFSLDGGAVTSVSSEDKGVVVGVGDAPSRVFVSFLPGESTPSKIETEDGSLSLTINKFTFTETDEVSGGTGENDGHRFQAET